MQDLDKRIKSYLVINAGFSKRNAEITLDMLRADELTEIEKEVITKIQRNPDTAPFYTKGKVLDHLNYRITQNGGDAVTRQPKYVRKISSA